MSSTNRSRSRDKHVADHYKTPVKDICQFLMAFSGDYPVKWEGINVLDPCAGGLMGKDQMSYPEALIYMFMEYKDDKIQLPMITTLDIREDSCAAIKPVDYRLWQAPQQYDMIITNPPFGIALEIIQKALKDCREGGLVIMLLRLNFFGSKARSAWFKENMPAYCYVHPKRMSFTPDGQTDSVEYAHNIWIKGKHPKFTQMRIL